MHRARANTARIASTAASLVVAERSGGSGRTSFPDWRSELHQIVTEGDTAAGAFTVRGSFTGSEQLLGFAPNARSFTFTEASLLTIRDRRADEGRLVGDELAVLHAVT